jgi:hypothetical protein
MQPVINRDDAPAIARVCRAGVSLKSFMASFLSRALSAPFVLVSVIMYPITGEGAMGMDGLDNGDWLKNDLK